MFYDQTMMIFMAIALKDYIATTGFVFRKY